MDMSNRSDKIDPSIELLERKEGSPPRAYVIVHLDRAVEHEKARARQSEALANIRRRSRALPLGVPDVVTLLRRLRGYAD